MSTIATGTDLKKLSRKKDVFYPKKKLLHLWNLHVLPFRIVYVMTDKDNVAMQIFTFVYYINYQLPNYHTISIPSPTTITQLFYI